jgi:hypothetical protein
MQTATAELTIALFILFSSLMATGSVPRQLPPLVVKINMLPVTDASTGNDTLQMGRQNQNAEHTRPIPA